MDAHIHVWCRGTLLAGAVFLFSFWGKQFVPPEYFAPICPSKRIDTTCERHLVLHVAPGISIWFAEVSRHFTHRGIGILHHIDNSIQGCGDWWDCEYALADYPAARPFCYLILGRQMGRFQIAQQTCRRRLKAH